MSSPSPIRPPDNTGNKKLRFDDELGATVMGNYQYRDINKTNNEWT